MQRPTDPPPLIHRNLALLEVSSPEVLSEIRAVVPLESYVLGTVSETQLIIEPARIKDLREALEARGLSALVRRRGGA